MADCRVAGIYRDMGTCPHQVLSDTLTLLQSEGADYSNHIKTSPHQDFLNSGGPELTAEDMKIMRIISQTAS